ncbi:LPD38 domain-containing protein [Labrys miyagiensis]
MSLWERFGANVLDSAHFGTITGAGTGAAMQEMLQNGAYSPENAQAAADALNRRHDEAVQYENMPSWSGPLEGAVALAGQMVGGMTSPESLVSRIPGVSRIFGPITGRAVGRIGEAAVSQGIVNTATDPLVQGLNIKSGQQKEFDWERLALAFPFGAALGGGLHGLSEGVGAMATRWFGKAPEPGARVQVNDFDPSIGPGEFHGDQGTVVGPSQVSPEHVEVKLDNGQQVTLDPRILDNPEIPQQPEVSVNSEGKPEFPKDGPARSVETVAADRVAEQISEPAPRTPDEITARLERDAGVSSLETTPPNMVGNSHHNLPGSQVSQPELPIDKTAVQFLDTDKPLFAYPANSPPRAGGRETDLLAYPSVTEGNITVWYKPGKEEDARLAAKLLDSQPKAKGENSLEGLEFEAKRHQKIGELLGYGDNAKAFADRFRAKGKYRDDFGWYVPYEGKEGDLQFRQRVAGSQPPAAPAGSPAGTAPDAVTSLHQQSLALGEALDMPLRQGRVQGGKQALGQFDVRQGVARTKVIADFDTVSHEAGHYLEQKVGKDLTALIRQHGRELGPMDYDAARKDPGEGFAEFARLYLTNPNAAQRLAPGFAKAFKPFMEQRAPDALKALDAAQAAHTAYVKAPSDVKLDAIVQRQDHGGVIETLRKEGFGRSVGMVLQKAYTALIDDKAPLARVVRDLSRMARDASGVRLKLEGSDNPELLLRMFNRAHQSAVRDMLDGVRGYRQVTPAGPSLRDAIVTATGSKAKLGFWNDAKVKEFSNYLVARRGDVLWTKYLAGDLEHRPLALSQGDVQAAIAKAEKENPTFQAAASQVHDYTRQLLRKQFEAGLIDRNTFDALQKEPFYVPFYRVMEDKPLASGGPKSAKKSEGPGKTDLVKRIRGSDRDIIDPLQSLMTQTFLVDRTVAHNEIVRSLVGLARKVQRAGATGTGRILEEIPAHQVVAQRFDLAEAVQNAARENGTDPLDTKVLLGSIADVFGDDPIMAPIFRREPTGARGEPILFYKEGGQLRAVRLMADKEGHELYETLASLPQHANDIFVGLGSAFAVAKRAGITSNPVFALTNWFRDQLAATIIRPDYVPFDPRGLARELTQGETAQLYTFAGGVSPGSGAAGLSEMVRGDIDALSRKGWFVQRVGGISDLMRHGDIQGGLKSIAETVGVAESGTRLNVMAQVFKQKKAQGLNEYDAMMEAAWQATDLMDFGRHGSRTLSVRSLIPFLNASVVSLDKANRTLIQPLVRAMRGDLVTQAEVSEFRNAGLAWLKLAGVGGALGYMYGMMMADNDAYRDANDQLRATHLIIPGAAIGQPGKIMVVPKPFELAIGFNLGEMLGMQVATGDPRTAGFAMDGVMEVLSPPSILSDIPLVSTYAELKLNRSFFTGRDIVPDRLQRLDASQQFNDKTSSFAKVIGNALDISPIKVDYTVGSLFGMWGRDLVAGTTLADPNAPDPALEDTMFLRRFVKNADISSETTKQFWNIAGSQNGEFATAQQTYESFLNQYRDEDAQAYLSSLPDEKRAYVTLTSAANEDGKPAFTADEKRLNPLYRAAAAVQTINAYVRDLSVNTQRDLSSNQRMDMDPTTRRQLIDNLRQLAAMEQRNALVMMKEPGYGDRKMLSPEDQFDVIMAISPAAGTELATRYATAKIYKSDVVAKAWPEVERNLLADGSLADISSYAIDAKSDGYAFDGDRVTKAGKRRIMI